MIDFFEKAVGKLQSEDTAWYKQPWFVLSALVLGIALALYVVYIKNQVSRLKAEKELNDTLAETEKTRAKLADHKKERARLENKAQRHAEKAAQVKKRLEDLQSTHKRIDEAIRKVSTQEKLEEIQKDIDENHQETSEES